MMEEANMATGDMECAPTVKKLANLRRRRALSFVSNPPPPQVG